MVTNVMLKRAWILFYFMHYSLDVDWSAVILSSVCNMLQQMLALGDKRAKPGTRGILATDVEIAVGTTVRNGR